jgi:hypothetical protein
MVGQVFRKPARLPLSVDFFKTDNRKFRIEKQLKFIDTSFENTRPHKVTEFVYKN